MFQKGFFSRLIILSVIAVALSNGFGQSVFRVGAWCFFHEATDPNTWPIYFNTTFNQWRVKGAERDKMLNLGLNHMIACANLQGEDALAIMGDSLFSAPSPRNFRSTLTQVENVPNYYPHPAFGNSVWRFSRTAENYPADTSWVSYVNVGYNHMYSRNQNRLNGVHSFLALAEGCTNQLRMMAGINFMCNNTIVDSYVQPWYVPTPFTPFPCDSLTTYEVARRLVSADHFMGGGY